MRIILDIADPMYRELMARAAQQGCSVKEMILRGVEKELRPRKTRIRLPLVKSKQPATFRLTNETIYEIIPFP